MPQELNPEITLKEIKGLLAELAEEENVVVIVPSKSAAKDWGDIADQTLMAANVVDGVDKLREGHVGLTVLVNRYDGIDLPHDACRVLVIYNLPEVASFSRPDGHGRPKRFPDRPPASDATYRTRHGARCPFQRRLLCRAACRIETHAPREVAGRPQSADPRHADAA